MAKETIEMKKVPNSTKLTCLETKAKNLKLKKQLSFTAVVVEGLVPHLIQYIKC